MLTIAIPTYNRAELLDKNIEIIVRQLSFFPNVKLLVLDNYSSDNTSEVIRKYAHIDRVKCYKNPFNVGADANALRLVEYIDTEYILILGDDDFLKEDAIHKILKLIEAHSPNWINFYSKSQDHLERESIFISKNLRDFLKSIYSWNELLFISNNVFKRRLLIENMRSGYFYQTTQSGYLISILLSSIDQSYDEKYIATNEEILRANSLNVDDSTSYSIFPFLSTMHLLLTLDWPLSVGKEIRRLLQNTQFRWLTNVKLFKIFGRYAHKNGIIKTLRFCPSIFLSFILIYGFRSILRILSVSLGILIGPLILRLRVNFKQ